VAPFAPSESVPQWDRCDFAPSKHTRAAFEHSHDAEQYEVRAREGLGVSVRFPATRTALWHSEAQGMPVHVTHDTCLPSVCLPPSIIQSLRSFQYDAVAAPSAHTQRSTPQLELVGQVTEIDHQLAYSHSMTRGKLQVILDILRQKGEQSEDGMRWGGARGTGDEDVCAALLQRQQDADDAETLSADEEQAAVTSISTILKERRHLASALDYLKISLLCSKTNGNTLTLVCQATLPCVSFMLTPLRLLKVIPTSLSQTLYERVSADAQPATGFMSMDQTRRLLLIPQLDPKTRQVQK